MKFELTYLGSGFKISILDNVYDMSLTKIFKYILKTDSKVKNNYNTLSLQNCIHLEQLE